MIAFCWASGLIQFGHAVPDGAIEIARGGKRKLPNVINVVARHGYEKGVLLVPGVPEAETQEKALDALEAWLRWCAKGERGVRFNVPVEHVGVQLHAGGSALPKVGA